MPNASISPPPASPILETRLSNGMPLLLEPMPSMGSVALCWLLPLGDAGDPEGRQGEAALLSELALRGAGDLDSRAFSDALDRLGVQRSLSNGNRHLRLSATLLGRRLGEALPLLVDLVRRPRLPAEALDPVKQLCLQSLESLQDEPQRRVMLTLAERHHPPPFGRSGYGVAEHLRAATIDDLRARWAQDVRPANAVLAIAGAFEPEATVSLLDRLLQDWEGRAEEPTASGKPPRGTVHLEHEGSQVHLGVALDAPPQRDPEAVHHLLATRILGGGSSSRLFVEVREKRGLCYSVGASCSLGRDRGVVSIYVGSTPERIGESRSVILQELERLAQGISAEEFDRALVGYRTAVVMQGESTAARAGQLCSDFDRLGRGRTLPQIAAEAEALDRAGLERFIADRLGAAWRENRTEVSLGPQVEAPAGI